MYSTLLRGILFYEKLNNELYLWGYQMNQYHRFTFNKIINNKQITIHFFVDDLKVLNIDGEVFKKEIEKINDKLKTKTQQLNNTKGDVHDYLGLTLDYSHDSCKNHHV